MELSPGPEKPTLTERLVNFLRLPYVLSCAVLALLHASVAVLLVLRPFISESVLSYAWSSWVLANFYLFYAPHYMRSRLLRTEKSLVSLLPRGENDFHHLFGSVSDPKPQLALWIAFSFVIFANLVNLVSTVVLYPFLLGIVLPISIAMSSIVWVYIGSLRGLHRMGRTVLRFTAFYKDRILGLRDVGSLALALTLTYFGFVLVSALPPLTLYAIDPVVWAVLGVLVMLGVAMFFLPLRGLHLRMLEQKRVEKEKLDRELEEFYEEKVTNTLEGMSRMFRLDILRREFMSTATWPYDIQILSKLTVISMSLTAILLSRLIAAIIGI